MDTASARAWLLLCRAPGIGSASVRRLLEEFPDAEGIRATCPSVRAVSVNNISRQTLRYGGRESRLTRLEGIDDYVGQARSLAKRRGALADAEFGEGFRQHVALGFPRDEVLSGELGERVQLRITSYNVCYTKLLRYGSKRPL